MPCYVRIYIVLTILLNNEDTCLEKIWLHSWEMDERGEGGGGGKLPVPRRSTNLDLDLSRPRPYCFCSRCGLFGHFFKCLSFLFSFSLSLRDGLI